MITFHSRQSDCARHTRKNKNVGTFNFTSQIAPSICTVAFTKREKSDATIFTSRCSRTVLCYRFDRVEALPLNFVRFLRLVIRSPMNQRSPARWTRDGRATSGKIAGEMSRGNAAHFPGNSRTTANAVPSDDQEDGSRDNSQHGAQRPHRSPRNRRCSISRNILQVGSSGNPPSHFQP